MPSIQGKMHFEQKGIGAVPYTSQLRVPLNQREYSWQEEHVDDLFKDLAGAIAQDKTYFLGTIVLTQGGREIPEVSDGQQRLATTTILLAAIRDWFYWNGEPERANLIEFEYLQRYDLDEDTNVSRLELNVDDRGFFAHFILPKPDTAERKNAKPTKESHTLIKQAANMAAQHVRDVVAPHTKAAQKAELNRWVKFIRNEAQVVVLNVPDDVDAYLLFETLNDRGLKASQADLLKNYLLSQTKNGMAEAQYNWAQMTGVLESLRQDDVTVKYLHHLLITLHGPTRAAEIFGKVKDTIKGQTQALKFLREAAEGTTDYAALFNPDHSKWNDYGTPTRHHISTINRDLQVQQIRPLMFAVARHFSVKEARKAFELFVHWSVRFLVYGGRGGLLDRNYAQAAYEIGRKTIKTADELTNTLANIIPSDAAFQTAFSEARVSAAPLARYYLRALEKKYKGDEQPEWVPSDEETVINLEHILPENPQSEWPHIAAETASAYYKRIGNMVLMQAKDNSIIGNAAFDQKKPILAASPYAFTNMVSRYSTWGTVDIEDRQGILAKWAVTTWPIRIK